VEIYLNVNCGSFNPNFEELKGRAQIIKGIPFSSLEDLRRFKKEYGREKDKKDINLIDAFYEFDSV